MTKLAAETSVKSSMRENSVYLLPKCLLSATSAIMLQVKPLLD